MQLLRDNGAIVGYAGGRNNPRNANVNEFMQKIRDIANPLDMDYPRDAAKADNGERMKNIRKASRACTSLIRVYQC